MNIETYPLFKKARDLIESYYTNGCIVEIGAGPHSTPFLGQLAIEHDIKMHSVDSIEFRLQRFSYHNIESHAMLGEDFLRDFSERIFFCYMDNFDWLNHWNYPGQAFYAGCTKEKSEEAHLKQSKLLIEKIDPAGYILFDDTGIEENIEYPPEYIMEHLNEIKFYGKGATAIPFLIKEGMKIIGHSANRHHGGFDGEHDQILLGF